MLYDVQKFITARNSRTADSPGLTVLTTSTVLHVSVAEPDALAHEVVSIVVTEAGTVVTLLEVEVEKLLVVNVPNSVLVGTVWHTDIAGNGEQERT